MSENPTSLYPSLPLGYSGAIAFIVVAISLKFPFVSLKKIWSLYGAFSFNVSCVTIALSGILSLFKSPVTSIILWSNLYFSVFVCAKLLIWNRVNSIRIN